MRTVRLLADVTKQVAVVQYPSMIKSKVRHVELVSLNPSRMMMILITDSGRVEQRVIELNNEVNDIFIASLRNQINNALAGYRLPEVADGITGIMDIYSAQDRKDVALLISALLEMSMERPD
jgi:heat-inducible transcriptional repressor